MYAIRSYYVILRLERVFFVDRRFFTAFAVQRGAQLLGGLAQRLRVRPDVDPVARAQRDARQAREL